MRIGILAAMKDEMKLILDRIENLSEEECMGVLFHIGNINDNEVILCESGIGKVNAAVATTLLISNFEVELVINTGIAGGIGGAGFKDVVIANGLSYHDFDLRLFGYDYGVVPGMPKVLPVNPEMIMKVKSVLNKLNINYKEGIVLSGDQFVSSLSKLENVTLSGALAVEMEGCAVAHVATKAGVDFVVLRYISDIVGAKSQNDDYLKFEHEMATRSAKICIKLVENL